MEDRTHKIYTDEYVAHIASTYHEWRKKDGEYEDIKGFCKSVPMEEVKKHGFVLTPGRYVGIPDVQDDGVSFEEKMKGSIEPGKLADFTVLSKDIMTVPEPDILKAEVVYTIVDGKVQHEKGTPMKPAMP